MLFGANVAHGRTADEVMADPAQEGGGRGRCRANCAAWCARTSRSTIPTRRWRATCGSWCASASPPAATDTQVIDFLVARYGEFVLLKPRVEGHTLILWLVPPLALLGGGFALWFYNRRRAQAAVAAGEAAAFHLTPEEEARLAKLMDDEERAGKAGGALYRARDQILLHRQSGRRAAANPESRAGVSYRCPKREIPIGARTRVYARL